MNHTPTRQKRLQLTGLWQHSDFMRLWLGQTVSEFGSMMGALSLLAILALNASPAQMGLLETLRAAPALLLGLIAGVWVDRRRRRMLLIGADIGRFLLLTAVALLTLGGFMHLKLLYLFAFFIGTLAVLFGIAYRSYLPSLVNRAQLVEANGKLSATESLAEIGAPGLGGLLAQAFSVVLVAAADGLTYLVSAFFLAFIKTPEPEPPVPMEKSIWQNIKAGMGYVWHSRPLRALALTTATRDFFGSFFAALYALYVLRQIELGPAVLGLLIGSGGIGAFWGSLMVGRISNKFGTGYTLIGALLFMGLVGGLVPLAASLEKNLATAALLLSQLLGDVAMSIFLITQISLRQALTPDDLLGRMNASFEFIIGGAVTAGIFTGGLLGEWLGVQQSLVIAVTGATLSCLWLAFSPVRKMELIEPSTFFKRETRTRG